MSSDNTDIMYNFDTFNQNYSSNTQYINNGGDEPNSYNIDLAIPQPLQNVKKIKLLSLEMPILFPNVRAPHMNFLTINNNQYYIPEANYNDITTLINTINTYANGDFTVSVASSGYLEITSTSNITLTPTILSYMLGFRGSGYDSLQQSGSNYILHAIYTYQLNVDSYLNMYIYNISTQSNNANQGFCSFKIPLNSSYSYVLYQSEFLTYEQSINVLSNVTINYLSIIFFDRFGITVKSYGGDWSGSLLFSF